MHPATAGFLLLFIVRISVSENRFYISTEQATFNQALGFCERFGMKLVTIDSEAKNADLYNTFVRLGEPNVWFWTSGIYLNDTMTEEWFWLGCNKEIVYSDWRQNDAPLEPNYYVNTDNCLRWGFYAAANAAKGLWRTNACSASLRFICEKTDCGKCANTCSNCGCNN